ncbi:leucine-rich repeat-containing protein 34 isoform X3 [Pseudorasbora parva]|uniref:leucine-rich repeat-containing protein 34 isoform X3 n=1 Tax=Pseudorasbora parva TaxID=51549 RepID=UPI00351E1B80
MVDIMNRYLSVCAEVQQPPNTCVLKVLEESSDGSLKLAGNDQLNGDRLTDDDVLVLSKTLVGNSAIKGLDLRYNCITDKGAVYVADLIQDTQSVLAFAIVLKNNRRIRAINISRPLIFSLQEETTVHMAQMLVVNKTLRELHMGKHGMTDTGVKRLCEALKLNTSLCYLDLRCNRITRDGAKCLSEVLKQNCYLEILDLSSNRIEDDGAVYLSEAIKLPDSKLKALSVTSNNIGKEGLMSLDEAMRVNSCLTHIYIWGNKLEEPVCMAFSRLITSGRLLEEHTDVSPYEVDGHVFLAEASHGLRRHYYWTSRYGEYGDSSNSALALMASDSSARQIYPDSYS